ncbi:helix-turn-helix DNA-binding domain protein [Gordonia phage Banquo]|uniref:Helix-turn-helix DNA-binding domain protein n=1 Tax=Gordonia phage TinaLin TaxID=2797324 RepID=A0A7T7K7Y8_9CAUD|nr:DNA binding protein [Gordonia phage TinaLin]QQM15121.1 helix-turn-helix DNA-binding domain protein [Gordonia phage TinaLin]URM87364.1 helix-turn-helix DNA-binding domain protein [Gordonia phage Banquo]
MIEYMSRGDIAEYLDVTVDTVKSYDKRGYLPEPDATIGRVFGWKRETIERWAESRPGRGTRTDCTAWTVDADAGHRITCERDPGHRGKHQRGTLKW